MSIIRLPRDAFDVFTVNARPARTFVSSSDGKQGSVKVFKKVSEIEKDTRVFNDTEFSDNTVESFLNSAIQSLKNTIPNVDVLTSLEKYIDGVNKLDSDTRKELRKKINFLTRRLSWKIKTNQDNNFFIVDDSYDKDYDIMAFDKSMKNPEIFAHSQTKIIEKIKMAKTILQLEAFFNTQGHLVVRPPQYNKIPSSIHYKMLQLKNDLGIELYPSYLEKLFVDQLTTAVQNKARLAVDEDGWMSLQKDGVADPIEITEELKESILKRSSE